MSLGIGLAVGALSQNNEDLREQQGADLDALSKELSLKLGDVLYQQAYKIAVAEVHEAILDELRLAQQGQLARPVLSDHRNSVARNEEFVRRADAALQRISEGRLRMSQARKDRILQ